MGVLGGLFLVFLVLLVFMFMGFYVAANETVAKVKDLVGPQTPKYSSNGKLGQEDKVNIILNHLDGLGFFNSTGQERVFMDPALSQAISECSKEEGFFWGFNTRGIRIKPNTNGGMYDYWLIYTDNKIGFNWQGSI